MTVTTFPAFYTNRHWLHNPPHSYEQPSRADLLLAALAAEPAAVLHEAGDFGLDPIRAVHTPELIHFLESAFNRFAKLKEGPRPAAPDCFAIRDLAGHVPRSIWGQLGHYCTDTTTPLLENSWDAAYASAQVALSAAQAVGGGAYLAYALCRPPGHHAYADMYGGYCYLNNAAIAAQWLVGLGKRVAVLDIDYHHGNGTQSIFYRRADVFVVSVHADPDDEYPYYWGYAVERGEGEGLGYNLNLLLALGTGEADYLAELDVALSAVDRFAPDAVVVSLGYDTLSGDPEGTFSLTTESFLHVGRRLRGVDWPLVLVQEGGYLPEMLGLSLSRLLQGILQD